MGCRKPARDRDMSEMWPLSSHFQYCRFDRCGAVFFLAALSFALASKPVAAQQAPQDLPSAYHGSDDGRATSNPPSNPPTNTATGTPSTTTKPKKQPKPYGGGSPLDVLLHTKLWEVPPEAKPFVKETRVPVDSLHYQPTIGTDPARPKVLTKDQLQSLQGELEQAGAHNEKAAGVKTKDFADVEPAKPAKQARKGKGKEMKAHADAPTDLHVR